MAAPEQNRQQDHESRVCSQVCREGEVCVQSWCPQTVLQPCDVRSFPPHDREELFSEVVSPFWKSDFIVIKRSQPGIWPIFLLVHLEPFLSGRASMSMAEGEVVAVARQPRKSYGSIRIV